MLEKTATLCCRPLPLYYIRAMREISATEARNWMEFVLRGNELQS